MRHLLLVATLSILGVGAGCTADLRPDKLKNSGIQTDDARRGRALLEDLTEAHGGLERWREHETATVVLRDTWPGWMMRTAAMPWFENAQLLRVESLLGTDDGRITFAEPPNEDLVWGVQDWVTYTVPPGGEPERVDDDNIRFWVPTVTYFFEAPFRLHEAEIVTWIGEETVDGTTYDKVFMSWNEAAPQDDIDQYVAWIDRDTGRLGYLAYTVRDMMQNITGFMRYTDYVEVDGIWVAKTMAVVDDVKTMDGLHRMDVDEVSFGTDIDRSTFYPFPDASRSKHP